MSLPRFNVARACVPPGPGAPRVNGWAVFDSRRQDLRITIAWANYAEALEHRDAIHRIYLRFGW